jgi:hypothetical protein
MYWTDEGCLSKPLSDKFSRNKAELQLESTSSSFPFSYINNNSNKYGMNVMIKIIQNLDLYSTASSLELFDKLILFSLFSQHIKPSESRNV